jgi:predicted nucleic acid-binding protein
MKYIIDSCVAVKWAIAESDTDKALRVRDDFRAGLVELVAPDVFPVEFVHAVTRAERQGRVLPEEGGELVADLLRALPQLYDSLPLLPRAYELSSQARIGVYDCLYVALAEREQCELLTADQRLVNVFRGYPVIALSSL